MLTPLEPWSAGKIGQPGRPLKRADLEAYQLDRLRATLDLARTRSPFYRRHLAEAPARLEALAGLARLPFTTAADLRAQPLQFLCVSQDEIQRVVTLDTSGTTGAPKRLYFTRPDQALTVDFFRVGMSTFTAPGDRVLILLPGETPGSVGDLLGTALRELGAEPIQHGPVRDPGRTLAAAAESGANVLVGVPAHVLKLVRAAPPGAPRLKLKSALLTTDHVPAAIVRAVEAASGGTVYNHYGMTEMGLGGGVDCARRRGYHLREADLLFEVVDPDTGTPLPDGEPGEVVFTTLTRTGMPLIRYRTGDLGRFLPDACPCGTGLRTLAYITTRLTGRVELGGGSLLTMPALDESLFALADVLNFAATIRRGPARTRLELAIQVRAVTPAAQTAVAEALDKVEAVRQARATGDLDPPHFTLTTEPVLAPGLAKRALRVSS